MAYMKTAADLFLEKYGNKITASDSWVIRFAEEHAEQVNRELINAIQNLLNIDTSTNIIK